MEDPRPSQDKAFLLEEEAFLIRNSGEIPEVALHGSLYYLTDDPEGPGLELSPKDIRLLQGAVVARYRWILLRDLTPANRDLRIFRGLARCVANWGRLCRFADAGRWDLAEISRELASNLLSFLEQEGEDVRRGRRLSSINCPAEELLHLARALGLETAALPPGWQKLCPDRK